MQTLVLQAYITWTFQCCVLCFTTCNGRVTEIWAWAGGVGEWIMAYRCVHEVSCVYIWWRYPEILFGLISWWHRWSLWFVSMSLCADSHACHSLRWNLFVWTFLHRSQRRNTSGHVKDEKAAPKTEPWCHAFHQSIQQQSRLYQLHRPYILVQMQTRVCCWHDWDCSIDSGLL